MTILTTQAPAIPTILSPAAAIHLSGLRTAGEATALAAQLNREARAEQKQRNEAQEALLHDLDQLVFPPPQSVKTKGVLNVHAIYRARAAGAELREEHAPPRPATATRPRFMNEIARGYYGGAARDAGDVDPIATSPRGGIR